MSMNAVRLNYDKVQFRVIEKTDKSDKWFRIHTEGVCKNLLKPFLH